jgi:hypothetical protein
MKKKHVLGLVWVVAMLAGFLTSPSAFADRFLLNGEEILSEITAKAETDSNDLFLEDMNGLTETDILCSGFYDYLYVISALSWRLEQVLMLDDKPLLLDHTEGEPGLLLDCVDMATKCSNGEVDVAAHGIPWKTELTLSGSNYDLLILSEAGKEPGYIVICTILGILVEDVCTGEFGMILTNVTGGIDEEVSSSNETIDPPLKCSIGGEKQGLMQSIALLSSSSGTLSVSE